MVSFEELFKQFLQQRLQAGLNGGDLFLAFKEWVAEHYQLTVDKTDLNPSIYTAASKFLDGEIELLTKVEMYSLFATCPNSATATQGRLYYCCVDWVEPKILFTGLKGPKEVKRYLKRLAKKLPQPVA